MPAKPGSIDADDVLAASRKAHGIGADLAAAVIRRCATKDEALSCVHAALTMVRVWYDYLRPESKGDKR